MIQLRLNLLFAAAFVGGRFIRLRQRMGGLLLFGGSIERINLFGGFLLLFPLRYGLFMLDEFAALGQLEMVQTAMGLMRGYGVKLWPILQDLSQL